MKTCLFYVGLPGSGKSTFYKKNHSENTILLSSDDYIEKKCKENNVTYSEGFLTYITEATASLTKTLDYTLDLTDCVLVWDQTNLQRNGRKIKLKLLKSYKFDKISCLYFPVENTKFWLENLKNRAVTEGKDIPEGILFSMKNRLEEPVLEEGFDDLVKYTLREDYFFHKL